LVVSALAAGTPLVARAATTERVTLGTGGVQGNPPALPLSSDPQVVVQLTNDAGACWEARLSAPAKNESGLYRARSD